MKVGVVGSGEVGETLANGFLKHGHDVMRGSRDPRKLDEWRKSAGPKASVGSFADVAKFGQMVVLAVKGTAAEDAVRQCGVESLAGKVVVDATNPITDAPPKQGVLQFFTTNSESLMERLQRLASRARFVKAFNSVGAASMVNPDFGGTRPTMFVCGEDAGAKSEVTRLLADFGWDVEDMGGAIAARAIEPLCMLWCIPGFLRDEWSHAFKLLKKK